MDGAVVCDTKKDAFEKLRRRLGGRKRLTGIIPSRGDGGAKPENQGATSYRLPVTPANSVPAPPKAHADSRDYQLREITVTHILQVMNCKTESFISRLLSDSFAPD